MPFYRSCSAFATANLGTLDAFSHLCIDTAYGADGHACDAAYLTLGLADVSLACHCSTPECGLMDGPAESVARCSGGCAAEFQTFYSRCQSFLQDPSLNGRANVPAW